MKPHLPKKLTAALLAAVAATSAHAITTSTTTYADGTVFNGDIWTWNNYSDGTNVSAANSKFTNYSTGQQYAGDASLATIGGPDKFWKVVQFNSETEYVGNTLRFAGNPGNIRLNTDYNAWVWIGGIITEAGNSGTFTLGRDSSDFRLKGNHDVNLIIGSNFTLKSGSGRSTEIMTGGTWDVASGKTLTFTGKSLTFYAGQAVDITGGGTVVFDTPFTGQVGSRFSVGGDATLTFNQAATLGGTIANSGNVNFRGAVTLSDSLSGFDATGSYVDYNGDTAANGYAGALEYTIVSGTGNVEGLSTVTWNGTTKQVVNGKVTIGGAVDYSTYHLLTPGAELDLAAELQRNSLLTTVSLSAGTTLHVNTDFGGTVEALGAASVDIASAKVFSGSLSGGVLQGAGTYALAADQSSLGSVSLGQGWTGAVRLSGSIADLKLDAAQLGNKVELMGVSGHFFALQADETATYTGTLALNNAGTSTPALLINNGYSRDNAYYQLAGAVEGGGIWRFDKGGNAVTNRIVFSGDVSAWNGALEVVRGFNVDLTFAHRNGTVNAALSRSQGTLTVHVDEDTTFNAALTDVSEFTVAAGKTAALNADFSVSTVNLSGTLDLGGRSVEIATLTSADDATLLKNGTVTGGLAISGSNLTADGVRFTPETSLSVEDAGDVSFCNASTTTSPYGGAIYAESGTVSLTGNDTVTFSGNSVFSISEEISASGGAIYASGIDISENGGVVFSDNYADPLESIGGAIYSDGVLNLTNNGSLLFSGNRATWFGGAIYASGAVNITGNGSVAFSNNISGDDYHVAHGGAVYASSDVDITGNGSVEFIGNKADDFGGAVFSLSASTITNNEYVAFIDNSVIAQGGAINSRNLVLTGNDCVVYRGNHETMSDGSDAYRLRSVYISGGSLKLAAGEGQNITFYDSLSAAEGTSVSFNAAYRNKVGVMQEATGDIVFSGAHAEEDLRELKPDYTAEELAASKTTEVYATTNLYGGRLRIEDCAIYKGNGINVAAGSNATLRLADGTLDQTGYNVTLSAGTTLDLQGVNTITANTLDMQSGSAITFTVGEGNLATPLLTLTGTFLQEGGLILDVESDGTAVAGNTYALLQTDGGLTPGSWNPDQIIVGGMLDDVSSLKWENGILYGTLFLKPELTTATWSGAVSMAWNTENLNWSQGEYAYRYTDGVDVVFDNSGAAGEVELQGEFSPVSVLVDNDAEHGYTFSGEGRLTGDMQLTKDGEGTLTINTENDYTGGTILNAGTLEAGNASAFGSGSIQINGGTLNLGWLTVSNTVAAENAEVVLRNGSLSGDFTVTGGSLDADGVHISAQDISIENAETVSFRNASSDDGGAVCLEGYGNAFNLTGNGSVVFEGNTASAQTSFGGAISGCTAGVLNLKDNASIVFRNNSAEDGGAISIDFAGTLNLENNDYVLFEGNTSTNSYYINGGIISTGMLCTVNLANNGSVNFIGNASSSPYGDTTCAAIAVSGDLFITGNEHVEFRKNYAGAIAGSNCLRSVYVSSDGGDAEGLTLSAGQNQDIVFYDTLYVTRGSNAIKVSFNRDYTDKDGVSQRATGDIVFSGKHAEEDLRELKPNYALWELTDSLTSEVHTNTNLYGGRLRIEDGAIYKGYGISVAADSNATLRLANGKLDQAGYDVTLASGTTLDLQGVNTITAATLDMQSGSTLAFTLDSAHADTAILTLDGTFNQGGLLTISLAADGTLNEGDGFLLMSLADATTPASWNKNLVTVTGLGAKTSNLTWNSGGLYFTYGDIPLPDKYRWTGASSMTWNTSAVNWTCEGQSVAYRNGVDVVFGNTGIGGEVELQGELLPANVLVDNDAEHGYTFTGNGKLTGDMLLTKTGDGTLTVNTANDYTGGTILSGGTLVRGNENAFGTGPIIMNGGTLDLGGGTICAEDIVFTPGAEICLSNGELGFHEGNTTIQGAGGVHADRLYVDVQTLTIENSGAVSFMNNENVENPLGGAVYVYGDGALNLVGNESVTFIGNSIENQWVARGGAISTNSYTEMAISRNGNVRFVGNSVSAASAGGGAISCDYEDLFLLNENVSLVFDGNSASGDNAYGGAIALTYADLHILNNGEVAFTNNRSADAQQVTAAVSGQISGSVRIQGNDHVIFRGNGFGIALNGELALSAGQGQSIDMYDMMYVSSANVSFNSSYTDAAGNLQRGEGGILISGRYLDEDYDWNVGVLPVHDGIPIQVEKHTTHVDGLSTLYAGRLSIEDGAVYEGGGFAVAAGANATLALRNATMVMIGYHGVEIPADVNISAGSTLELQGVNTISANSLVMGNGGTLGVTLDSANAASSLLSFAGDWTLGGLLNIEVAYDEAAAAASPLRILNTFKAGVPTWWDAQSVSVSGTTFDKLQWSEGILYLNLTGGDIPLLPTLDWTGGDMKWNGTSANWLDGGEPAFFTEESKVRFRDDGSGVVTLEGALVPRSVLVENTAEHDYTFTGSGKLTGYMQLTKDGEGTLTVNTRNDYTGGTVISGGTLVMGNENALGTGPVIMNGGTLDLGGGLIGAEDMVFTPGAEIGLRNGVLGFHWTEEDIFIRDAHGVHADRLYTHVESLSIENSGEISFRNNDTAPYGFGGAVYVNDALHLIGNESVTFSGNSGVEYGGALSSGLWWQESQGMDISRNGNVRFAGNSVGGAEAGGGAIYCGYPSLLSLNENDSLVFDGNSVSGEGSWGGAIATFADLQILNNGEVVFTNNRSADAQNVTAAVSGMVDDAVRIQGNDHVLFRGNGFGIALEGWGELALSAGQGQSIEMYDMMYLHYADVTFNRSYTDAAGNLQRGEGSILISGRYLVEDYDWEVGELSIHGMLVPVEKHTTCVGGMSTLYAGRLSIEDGAVYEGGGFTVADAANATLSLRNASMVMCFEKLYYGYVSADVAISGGSTLDLQGVNTITANTLQMADGAAMQFMMGAGQESAILNLDATLQTGRLSVSVDGDYENGHALITLAGEDQYSLESWTAGNVSVRGTDFEHLEWKEGSLYYRAEDTSVIKLDEDTESDAEIDGEMSSGEGVDIEGNTHKLTVKHPVDLVHLAMENGVVRLEGEDNNVVRITLTEDGTLELAAGAGLKVGNIVSMVANGSADLEISGDIEISDIKAYGKPGNKGTLSYVNMTTAGDYTIENMTITGSVIDVGEGTTLYLVNVDIKSDTHITDAPARVFAQNARVELDGTNTWVDQEITATQDTLLYMCGDTQRSITLAVGSEIVELTSCMFDSVTLTGTDLWLDMTSLANPIMRYEYFTLDFQDLARKMAKAQVDVERMHVYATLDGEKYVEAYSTANGVLTTTLYFQVPEPATGTLSLLALAALAARRRRKH